MLYNLCSTVLGSAIIAEFILMLLLGGILLFFVCKCTNALGTERRSNNDNTHEENHVRVWILLFEFFGLVLM